MARFTQLRAFACAFTVLTLSACGGGGDSGDTLATPSSKLPADGYLSVDGGTSTVKVGAYQLDTNYTGASGTQQFDVDTLEYISPESPAFDAGFIFSQSNAQKFAVVFTDNATNTVTDFACRSSAWSAAEIQRLAADFNRTDIPVCQSGMTIDTRTHRIQVTALRVPSLNDPAKYVTISANFGWVLQVNALSNDSSGTRTGGSIVITGPTVGTTAPSDQPVPTVVSQP
ncbi:hypothetical protein JY96_14635 [Aquabacterium sp. NJ1]|uniref:hypothetical protein n=1 Tax=Aquabacterium sp. NJ1 TaxID=1538295 RepID=UPI00052BC757|nr:hypothetical protein [Aquabacterium sp. NJ1]KGM40866.1 hypothetical protein JY96_14635 [Aquabacterium sp. NJ1]